MDPVLMQMAHPFIGVPENITELYPVPENTVGLVIGKGGSEIQNIQNLAGCRVQMNQEFDNSGFRHVTLQGMRPNIEKAKMMIQEVILRAQQRQQFSAPAQFNGFNAGVSIDIPIPGNKCGLIIGKQGETIRHLQEATGCKMVMIQDTQTNTGQSKPLRVTGDPDKVEAARRMVSDVIAKDDATPLQRLGISLDPNAAAKGEVVVPRSSVGMIIGKGGETIKRLAIETGTKIQFKPDEDPNSPERCALIMGTRDQIYRATELITELVTKSSMNGNQQQEVFYMHIPANKTGLVIGKGGETIKQINADSGAHCELSRDPPPNPQEKVFMIRGTQQQIHHAQHIIRIKVGDIAPNMPVPALVGQQPLAPANGNGIFAQAPSFNGQYAGQPQQPQQQQAGQMWNNLGNSNGADNTAWNSNALFAPPGSTISTPNGIHPQAPPFPGAQFPHAGMMTGPFPQCPPTINPATGQPDYSPQWAEYYRSCGLMEQAAMVESQMKQNHARASSAAGVAAPTFAQYQNPNTISQQGAVPQQFAQYQNNSAATNTFPQAGQFQAQGQQVPF